MRWSLVLLLTCAGCFRFGADDGSGADAGPDPGCVDVTQPAASIVACDPVTGTRCEAIENVSCVWDPAQDNGRCNCSSERVALGERCDERRQNCEAGAACLFLQSDGAPTCRKVCAVQTQVGCEMLSNESQAFACLPVSDAYGNPTRNFGICVDIGTPCDPLQDACPMGETCSLVGRANSCLEGGDTPLGGLCENNNCAKGGLCVALQNADGTPVPPTCYEPCDPSNPSCMIGVCSSLGLPYGLCL